MNKCILIGNLGGDPEIKEIEGGIKVATFSIATTERWKDKNGEKQESTEWHNLVLWRGLAEVAEKFLKKGSQIAVEAKSTTRTWDDDNGQKKYWHEFVVRDLKMLGGKKDSEGSGATPPPPPPPAAASGGDDKDDLPF